MEIKLVEMAIQMLLKNKEKTIMVSLLDRWYEKITVGNPEMHTVILIRQQKNIIVLDPYWTDLSRFLKSDFNYVFFFEDKEPIYIENSSSKIQGHSAKNIALNLLNEFTKNPVKFSFHDSLKLVVNKFKDLEFV